MPSDDFNPDLTKLGQDYQVLTELHGEGGSRTYLARHLRLNRDVTISVFRAAVGDADALAQFASDAHLLAEARHPHVAPVIEGVWLDEQTFAIVRARVRGATLDQTLSASGPMSLARAAMTISDVSEALTWARETGVAQRDVVPSDVVFQQGNGRLLVAFEPRLNTQSANSSECDDANTVRRLAVEVLSGEIDRTVPAFEIAVPRSIPSDIADALAAIRHCDARNAASSLGALLTALNAAGTPKPADEKTRTIVAAERVVPTAVQRSADAQTGPIAVITHVPPRRRGSSSQRDDVTIVRKPSFGFNARLGMAIVVIAAAGTAGYFVMNRGDAPMTNVAIVAPRDTGTTAAGEVALHPAPPPPVAQPRVVTPRVTPTKVDSSAAAEKRTSARTKAVVIDSAVEAERQFKRDSAADVSDPCASSDEAKQHECLTVSIQRNDRELNAVLARLVSTLRREAGATGSDPDPDAVNDLRASERKWADDRDVTCREIGDAPLYAKSRAACYAQKATDRTRELQRRLDGGPPS